VEWLCTWLMCGSSAEPVNLCCLFIENTATQDVRTNISSVDERCVESRSSRQRPTSAVKLFPADSGHDSGATDVPAVRETPVSSPRAGPAVNDTGRVKRLRPFTADVRTRRDQSDQLTADPAPTMDDFHRVSFFPLQYSRIYR